MKITWIILALALCVALSGCGCAHQWSEATLTAPKTCALCGETEGAPLPPDQSEPAPPDACAHQWSAPTCAAPKTCAACGETEGDPLPHSPGEPVYSNLDVLTATAEYVVCCEACGEKLSSGQDAALSLHDGSKFAFQDPWQWQTRQLELGKEDGLSSAGSTTRDGEYVIQLYYDTDFISHCVFLNGDKIVSEQDASSEFTAVRAALGFNRSLLEIMVSDLWIRHAVAVMRTCDPTLTADAAIELLKETDARGEAVVSNGLSYTLYVDEESSCLTLLVQVSNA